MVETLKKRDNRARSLRKQEGMVSRKTSLRLKTVKGRKGVRRKNLPFIRNI